MVAVQVLLMHYFLLGLHNNHRSENEVFPPQEEPSCPLGCMACSTVNGCLACKPPFYLKLHRRGFRQTGVCTKICPVGFYKFNTKKEGVCIKCMQRGCKECESRRVCTSCEPGRLLRRGRCVKCRPKGSGCPKARNNSSVPLEWDSNNNNNSNSSGSSRGWGLKNNHTTSDDAKDQRRHRHGHQKEKERGQMNPTTEATAKNGAEVPSPPPDVTEAEMRRRERNKRRRWRKRRLEQKKRKRERRRKARKQRREKRRRRLRGKGRKRRKKSE
ncbi:R-spondin-4-like [Oratosquilla oratoria]|uniref:R-spondin-4-like n=1 Tax=Oratosquilla oratoria TaxID=337810 RepID=UPI003F76E48B